MDELIGFRETFKALTDNHPFPWQERLYAEWFSKGKFPLSCNLPTGLGKTSVVAIWLIALANHWKIVPRRLVYVVNRRTVVDQTTNEVEKLRSNIQNTGLFYRLDQLCATHLRNGDAPLAISTLRGQFADNREWSSDPCRPAVIVGTVDMIGSRLLFSGYGVGFKAKPLHAGFLGQDVLLIHDEAHLEPAFQTLIESILDEQKKEPSPLGGKMQLKVMALSATSRRGDDTFGLTKDEITLPPNLPEPPTEPIHLVWQRLKAKKGLDFYDVKRGEVAKQIGILAQSRKSTGKAILVFVRTVNDVRIVQELLLNRKDGVANDQVQVLTGTVRGLERDRLAKEDPIFARFLLKTPPDGRTVYLICTAAGEVGIDISADIMVCDLTPLDSMIQRLGRVNRRGEGAAEIDVVYEVDPDSKQKDKRFENSRWKTLEILRQLPVCDWIKDRRDVSPISLANLNLSDEDRRAAFSPEPTILPTSDILFDAWALTTISPPLVGTLLPGRPPVEPYLHGISDWQAPETQVAWRKEVEVITPKLIDRYKPEDLLGDYPLKPHELLRDRSDRVFDELQRINERRKNTENALPVWIEENSGRVISTTLGELLAGEKKDAVNRIAFCRVLLPPAAGGLTDKGTLDGTADFDSNYKLGYDVADEWFEDNTKTNPRRFRIFNDDPKHSPPQGMRMVRPPLDIYPDDEDEPNNELIHPRFWHWYELPKGADDEGSKFAKEPVEWDNHTNQVTAIAMRIAAVLELPECLRDALKLAAKFHDLGKKREIWQRSIGNLNPFCWHAKSGTDPVAGKLWSSNDICPNYRHEFGSLMDVESEAEFVGLPDEMKDLVLHLIAAHHGRGRPLFPTDEVRDPEPKGKYMAEIAVEVPRRFSRLQRNYGRWGLAYLESLLRAADYAASANPSQTEPML